MTAPTHPSDPTLSPLSDFIHEAFFDLAISTDDAEAEAALERVLSPHVQETNVATGAVTSRAGYRQIIKSLRAEFTDRKLVKDTYVIATPADASNRTVRKGRFATLSALGRREFQQMKKCGLVKADDG
ncbi:hypothetical protein DFH06DRAFT_1141285 [Mycena polygramma]|nr:hypothetical protein DFH06DRAFT_1141285 [Mycena polygramma]